MRKTLTAVVSLLAAFLMGASLFGVASGHPRFRDLLHSGHSDRMRGTLTARGFEFDRAKNAWYGLAAVSIRPIDPDDESCASGVTWNIPEKQDFPTDAAYVTSPPECWMGGQVTLPNKATITGMTMHIRDLNSPVTITFQLITFDPFGTGQLIEEESATKQPGDPSEPNSCTNACAFNEGVESTMGANPVINQRRTYILRYRPAELPINTTRLLISYTVRTPAP